MDGRIRPGGPVTLVGGGELDAAMLAEARAHAPALIAADGGADRLAALGVAPGEVRAVIGDLDSLADRADWEARGVPVLHLAEQDTTDFEKCLYATDAPLYVAAGFTGRRVDHMLAVFHALLRHPEKRVVVLGPEEAMALAPARLALDLAPGARVSVWPLRPVRGTASAGLRWPIGGLAFAAGEAIGTSNEAIAARVEMEFDGPGALVMVERRFLGALIAALG